MEDTWEKDLDLRLSKRSFEFFKIHMWFTESNIYIYTLYTVNCWWKLYSLSPQCSCMILIRYFSSMKLISIFMMHLLIEILGSPPRLQRNNVKNKIYLSIWLFLEYTKVNAYFYCLCQYLLMLIVLRQTFCTCRLLYEFKLIFVVLLVKNPRKLISNGEIDFKRKM